MEDKVIIVHREKGDPIHGKTDWDYIRAGNNGEITEEEDPENPFMTDSTKFKRASTGKPLAND